MVKSDVNSQNAYIVKKINDRDSCDCPDFIHRGRACKHIYAAMLYACNGAIEEMSLPMIQGKKREKSDVFEDESSIRLEVQHIPGFVKKIVHLDVEESDEDLRESDEDLRESDEDLEDNNQFKVEIPNGPPSKVRPLLKEAMQTKKRKKIAISADVQSKNAGFTKINPVTEERTRKPIIKFKNKSGPKPGKAKRERALGSASRLNAGKDHRMEDVIADLEKESPIGSAIETPKRKESLKKRKVSSPKRTALRKSVTPLKKALRKRN